MYAGTDGFGPHSTVAVRTRLGAINLTTVGGSVLGPVGAIGGSILGSLTGGHVDVAGEADPNVPKIRASSDVVALQIIATEGILPADKARTLFNINAPVNFGDGKTGRAYEAQVAQARLNQLTAQAASALQSAGAQAAAAMIPVPGGSLPVAAPVVQAGLGGSPLMLLLLVGAGVALLSGRRR